MRQPDVVLETELTPEQVVHTLGDRCDRDRFVLGPRRYTGRPLLHVRGDRLVVSAWPSVGSLVRPYFEARFHPAGAATRLEGRFSVSPGARVFVAISNTVVIVIGAVLVYGSLSGAEGQSKGVSSGMVLGLAVPCAVMLFPRILRLLTRDAIEREKREILQFLENALGTRDRPVDSRAAQP